MKQALQDYVWVRADGKCEYCQFPASHSWLPFQIDHVIAEKHGGQTTAENLALSCFYCNSFKGPNIAGIDPEGDPGIAVQLFHPRRQPWREHFEWRGPVLHGKSATGRTTIFVLRMNEPEAIEFRQLLLESGHRL